MFQMARHKFASNVCEKALQIADPENRRLLIDEIMTPKQDHGNPIGTMMRDQFASQCFILRPVRDLKRLLFSLDYVLQQALASVEGEQKEELFSKVRPQLASMRKYSSVYSRHLVSST